MSEQNNTKALNKKIEALRGQNTALKEKLEASERAGINARAALASNKKAGAVKDIEVLRLLKDLDGAGKEQRAAIKALRAVIPREGR